VGQPEDDRNDARERCDCAPSIEFFVNDLTFVVELGWLWVDALRRKFANVLRMSVSALFL